MKSMGMRRASVAIGTAALTLILSVGAGAKTGVTTAPAEIDTTPAASEPATTEPAATESATTTPATTSPTTTSSGTQAAPAFAKFDVLAKDAWVSTPFHVEAGQVYQITAKGQWTGSDGLICGPNGTMPADLFTLLGPQSSMPDLLKKEYFIDQNPRDSLVAKFGKMKWAFCVGTGVKVRAPITCDLFMRINNATGAGVPTGRMRVTLMEIPEEQVHYADKNGYVTISARIDSEDFLHFTPHGLWWEWGGKVAKPGEEGGHFPTIVGGICWWPKWTKKVTAPLRTDELYSDSNKMQLAAFDQKCGLVSVDQRNEEDFVVKFNKVSGFGGRELNATISLHEKIVRPVPTAKALPILVQEPTTGMAIKH